MNTVARPTLDSRAHYYYRSGLPCHTVIAKGTGEPRPTNLKDARILDLLPSVTTILKVLRKPELESWIIEQACLAVLTSPQMEGESLDEFVFRVLHTDRHQDQEREAAADLGTRIHAGLADGLQGRYYDPDLEPYIRPVLVHFATQEIVACERVVVGNGYAGTLDLLTTHTEYCPPIGTTITLGDHRDLWDFKSCKKLPDKSWPEHRLQLAAYAEALEQGPDGNMVCDTYNVYISTTEPGQFRVCKNPPWVKDWLAFEHLLAVWQWQNNFGVKA